jgi:hypothetical protein
MAPRTSVSGIIPMVRRMRLLLAAAAVCSILGPAGASAAARTPKLLAMSPSDHYSEQVRPTFLSFYHFEQHGFFDYLEGPGLTWRGWHKGRTAPVVWSHWGARATGRATYWMGYPPLCQPCKEIRRVVRLAAWRVREGHYTRLSITWRGSTVVYEIRRIRYPVNGVPGGELSYNWCWARYPRPCSPP